MDKALPLKQDSKLKIAVIGPYATATTELLGNYAGRPPHIISPVQGLNQSNYSGIVSTANGSDIQAAMAMAKVAEVVVLVVGLSGVDEGEGHDRVSLLYPGNQSALMQEVAAAASEEHKPVIVVTMGGGPVDLTVAKSNANISAIIWCGYTQGWRAVLPLQILSSV